MKVLKPATQRVLVYDELRRSLLTGRFAPGESFTIRELSEQLGIGVMPVREAVQQLASVGAFELLPSRSVRVPSFELDDLEALFDMRMLVECHAVRRAVPQMSDEDHTAIANNLERLLDEKTFSNSIKQLEANYRFHFSIYKPSQSEYVLGTIERLWLRTGPLHNHVFRRDLEDRTAFFASFPMHRKLVKQILHGDANYAAETLEDMIKASLAWYRDRATKLGLLPSKRSRKPKGSQAK